MTWIFGGASTGKNLALLCRSHWGWRDSGGWGRRYLVPSRGVLATQLQPNDLTVVRSVSVYDVR